MKRFFKYLLIGFLPSFLIIGFVAILILRSMDSQYENDPYWLGKALNEVTFYNANGGNQSVDFTTTDFTVVDFWFMGCAPCIEEMDNFDYLLKMNSPKLKIYSISVDGFSIWKELITNHTDLLPAYRFLASTNNPNWIHLVTGTKDSGKQNREIAQGLHIYYFPTYLILNQDGIVVNVRHSLKSFADLTEDDDPGIISYLDVFLQSGTKNIFKIIRAISIAYVVLYAVVFFLYKGFCYLKSSKTL